MISVTGKYILNNHGRPFKRNLLRELLEIVALTHKIGVLYNEVVKILNI